MQAVADRHVRVKDLLLLPLNMLRVMTHKPAPTSCQHELWACRTGHTLLAHLLMTVLRKADLVHGLGQAEPLSRIREAGNIRQQRSVRKAVTLVKPLNLTCNQPSCADRAPAQHQSSESLLDVLPSQPDQLQDCHDDGKQGREQSPWQSQRSVV